MKDPTLFAVVHAGIWLHPKLRHLAQDLEVEDVTAVGHLVALWTAALAQAPDGVLHRWRPRDVADLSRWRGPADAFVGALLEHGWLEQDEDGVFVIAGWCEYAGRGLTERAKELDRKKRYREKQKDNPRDGNGTSPETPANTKRDVREEREREREREREHSFGVGAAPPPPPAPLRPVIVVEPPPPPVESLEERAERAQSAAIVNAGVRDQFAARNARAGAALGRPQSPQDLLAMRVLVVDGEIVVRAGEGVTGQPLAAVWAKRYPSLDGKGSPQRASIAEVLVRAWVASCRWGWALDAAEYLSRWARILAEEAQKVRYAWERDGGTAGVGDPDRARARRRHHELQGLGRDLAPFDTWFTEVWSRGAAEDIAPSTPAGSGARPAGPRSGGVLRPADIDAQMALAHADRDEGAGAAGLALLRAATTKPVQVRAIEGDDIEVQA